MNRTSCIALLAAASVAQAQHVDLSLLAVGSDLNEPLASSVEINGGRRLTWELSASVTDSSLGLAFIAVDLGADGAHPAPLTFEQGVGGADFASFEPPLGFARLNQDDTSAFGGDAGECGLRDIGGGQNTAGLASTDLRFGQTIDPETDVGLSGWATVADGSLVMPDITGDYVIRIDRAGATVLGSTPIEDFATPVRKAETAWAAGEVTITVYCSADLDRNGLLDLADITMFVEQFLAMNPVVSDVNDDELFDLADITAFVGAFVSGCPSVPGHALTQEEQDVLEQLAQQMAQAGSGGLSAASMSSINVSLVDTVEPFGVVNAADIAAYIERFAARSPDADLTANSTVDVQDAQALLNAVENADAAQTP
ncbi:MAG: hypothetical protein H6810_04820 [Phycisphaeraceae bacterium]|nr:MAG: hypothetical protein H6810_04820 [Phycisphaeraceae bacterium]